MSTKTRKKQVNTTNFVQSYMECHSKNGTYADFESTTGLAKPAVVTRVKKLRELGVNIPEKLKPTPRKQMGRKPIDVEAIKKLVELTKMSSAM
jgi:hypothetical protein